ncbi:MAG: tRNA (adenosine(37)-N6)-dimethylallyltransferase MiaA [Planctomycetota bacterium]|nr:tRNA (adenosine(37)-N6)-dimethylallyltransferase MiaA [Planctomycetota bacterium]
MFVTDRLLDCWYLTGPTASGKTATGIALAERLGAEIISLDSMALYRHMDIGTAKPDAMACARVRHHLLDLIDPSEEYSLHDYVLAAHQAARDVTSRGRKVLFVGGTPLYLKALLRGIFDGPPPDWGFRESVSAEARIVGNEALHTRLRQVDPLSAAKLHPNDLRRVMRALEVYKMTGIPLGHLQLQFDEANHPTTCRVFALRWDRSTLHERINQRVVGMFELGLREEVDRLRETFPCLSRTASQAVGYRETLDLIAGRATLEEVIARVRTRTRQFAKRQSTWFRSLGECRSIDCCEPLVPEQIAEDIVRCVATT